jgi:anti-anti-sigma factor
MVNLVGTACSPALHVSRVPGEQGTIVRCSGELTVATGEALKRDLNLLLSLRSPALILNLSGCHSIDMEGVMLLLDTYRRSRVDGRRFVAVLGTEDVAKVIWALGIDGIIPTFPTEVAATRALRGGAPSEVAPETWSDARAESLAMWRAIQAILEDEPAEDVMYRMVSSHGLCRKAGGTLQSGAEGTIRCPLCPLLHALGARPQDIGCQNHTQPMLEALLRGDRRAARVQVARLIDLIETMPPPRNDADGGAS